MSDIFSEVDEEVRRERYLKLWQAYGKYAIAGVVVIALGVAGALGWREYKQRQTRVEGEQFATAAALLETSKPADVAAAFAKVASEATGGYRILAGLQAAAAYAKAGDTQAAVAAYDRIAADSGIDRRYRDLAAYLAALHLLNTGAPAELERRLQPLAAPESPWQYSARELLALTRLRAGDTVKARQEFTALADDAVAPAGIRARAAEMLAALSEHK